MDGLAGQWFPAKGLLFLPVLVSFAFFGISFILDCTALERACLVSRSQDGLRKKFLVAVKRQYCTVVYHDLGALYQSGEMKPCRSNKHTQISFMLHVCVSLGWCNKIS